MEFLGKFHPLIVHLPIGIFFAALCLEIVFQKKNSGSAFNAIKFLLGIGALSAIISTLFGFALSKQGGYENQLLSRHQWSAILFTVFLVLAFVFRDKLKSKRPLIFSWILMLLLLTLTGHYGGSLTHGRDYLVESAPDFIQRLFLKTANKIENKPIDSVLVFDDLVMPVIEDKCIDCHNNDKKKGGLTLKQASGWKKGGKTGPVVKSGNSMESLLLQRIYLPPSMKKHMPPMGNRQMLASEIALIEWWIETGGDFDVHLVALQKDERITQIIAPFFDIASHKDQIVLPDFNEQILESLQAENIRIFPAASGSNILEVDFSRDTVILDDHLKALLKLKENIIRIDFKFSGIRDQQLEIVNQFENLNYLSLAKTNISNNGVKHLVNLPDLQYLNLHSTNVSSNCLKQIEKMKNLQNLYVWNTQIDSTDVQTLFNTRPSLKVFN